MTNNEKMMKNDPWWPVPRVDILFCWKHKRSSRKTVYTDIKGFEWNMIFILNQTAPSLFSLTSNWLLSLWAWTEPGMKPLLSPTNPVRWVYVHRQPNKKTAVTGPVCGGSLMKPNEISLSKSATAFLSFCLLFFYHSSSSDASPFHHSLTQTL